MNSVISGIIFSRIASQSATGMGRNVRANSVSASLSKANMACPQNRSSDFTAWVISCMGAW